LNITKKWIEDNNISSEGVEWFEAQKEPDGMKLLEKMMKENQLDWANWIINKMFSEKQCRQYAVYAAEQVSYLWKDKYPKKYLKGFELRVKQEIPQDIDGLTGIVIHNMDIDDRKTGKEFISLMQVAQKKKLPTLIWSQDEEYFGKVQKRLKREGLNCQNMYFHSTRLCQTYWERMIEIFR